MKASARPPDAVDKHLKRGNRETERERERAINKKTTDDKEMRRLCIARAAQISA